MFTAVLSIFLLMFVGYLARRTGVLKASDTAVVRAIVANITGPAFVFASIYGKPITTDMAVAPVVHFVALMLVAGAAYLVARAMKLDRPTTGALILAAAFGNTGFLGYPVTMAAFPHTSSALPTAVMVDQLGMTVPLYSIGIAIALAFGGKDAHGTGWAGFIKTPLFLSMALVFALRIPELSFFGHHAVHLPAFIVKSVKYLGDATVPLAMISLGLSIARMPMKSVMLPFIAAIALKFVVLPIIALGGMDLAGIHGTVRQVSILESGMPTAIMASVIAGRYGSNGPFVAGAAFLMTLMSVVTIPLTLAILH